MILRVANGSAVEKYQFKVRIIDHAKFVWINRNDIISKDKLCYGDFIVKFRIF
jgi:hypothetical protein